MLQLKHGRDRPAVNVPNTFDAIERLHAAGFLRDGDYRTLRDGYRFLRSLGISLGLMNQPSSKHLPTDELELRKLAALVGFTGSDAGEKLVARYEQTAQNVAECFDRFFGVSVS